MRCASLAHAKPDEHYSLNRENLWLTDKSVIEMSMRVPRMQRTSPYGMQTAFAKQTRCASLAHAKPGEYYFMGYIQHIIDANGFI